MKNFLQTIRVLSFGILTLSLPLVLLAQDCEIGEPEATVQDCDSSGFFNVLLDFDYANVGDEGFRVQGNGNNYGNFEYEDLPVTIGPLEGDGETVYEFVVTDNQFEDCTNFTEIDPVDCGGNGEDCFISELTIDDYPCEDSLYNVYLNFEYENVSDSFKLFVDWELYGNYGYDELPLNIGPFAGDGETVYHFLVRDVEQEEDCASDANFGPVLCGEGGECSIRDMYATVLPCDENDEFNVLLNFEYENTGDEGFTIRGNGNNYGAFEYDDLPVELGPFPADGETEYEFEARDNQFEDCYDWTVVEPFLCDTTVLFSNLRMDIQDCENQTYYLLIDFAVANPGESGFSLRGNGTGFRTFSYDDLPVKTGPLTNDEITAYYFVIADNRQKNHGDWQRFSPFSCNSLGTGDHPALSPAISVYPNPAAGKVSFENRGSVTLRIGVFDLTGRQVADLHLGAKSVRELVMQRPGIYFYRATDGSSSFSGKFVNR